MTGRVYDAALPEGLLRLKVASKALVKAVHGTELAGEIAGMRQQRVSESTLPNCPAFFQVDQALAIEEAAKGSASWPQVTRAMARHHGFALLPLPEIAPGAEELTRAVSDVARETGESVSKTLMAIADGDLSARDVRELNLIEELDEAIEAVARLRALVVAAGSEAR